jgi:KDO2-lipid IV(A) lauroyltransferase
MARERRAWAPDPNEPTMTERFTALGYRAAALATNLTPGPVAQALSGVAGNGFALGMRSRRAMLERHLQRVNPRLQGWALRRAVQEAFDSYARYWLDAFRLPNLPDWVIDRGFTLDGYEHIQRSQAAGNGTILALPHLGGWEWAGRWMVQRGHAMTVVVEPLENRELFEWFLELREGMGMNVVPLGPNVGSEIVKALKANGVVCLLSDRDLQRTGVEVEFFGEKTTLPAGPATLALRTGATLLPVACYFTDEYNGHRATVRPPLPTVRRGALREDVTRVTQLLADEFEFLIRRAPEQWHLLQPNWPSDPGYDDRSPPPS